MRKVHNTFQLKKDAQNGFSLVELMVVLGVMSLLALASIPAVLDWLPNQRCKAAARDIYANFQKAKVTAIKTNINCAITFGQDVNGTNYDYVIYTDSNENCEYDASEPIIDMVLLSSYPGVVFDTSDPEGNGAVNGLTFIDNDAGLPTIAFQPTAVPTDNNGGIANGTVYIRNTRNLNYKITISTAGNVAIENLL